MIEDVSKAYGRRVIHGGVKLTIRRGERSSVMGRNGARKTTLLKMIAGVLAPDRGHVGIGGEREDRLLRAAVDRAPRSRPDHREQIRRTFPLESISALRDLLGAFQFSVRSREADSRPSGGEKYPLVMARMLPRPANFLVLDEPTNHLDLATKEMLVSSLARFDGTMIFVSHDRRVLRGIERSVLELGGEFGTDATVHASPGLMWYVQRTGHEAPGRARMVAID